MHLVLPPQFNHLFLNINGTSELAAATPDEDSEQEDMALQDASEKVEALQQDIDCMTNKLFTVQEYGLKATEESEALWPCIVLLFFKVCNLSMQCGTGQK